MKKSRRLISILAGAAMTAAMMSVMTGGAAAGGAAHVASPSMGWQASARASLTRSVLPTRAR